MNRHWHGIDLNDDDLLAMILRVNEKLDAATALLEAMRSPASGDGAGLSHALAAAESLIRSAKADRDEHGLADRPLPVVADGQ